MNTNENFSSNKDAIATILGFSLIMFIILVLFSILIPLAIIVILFRNINKFKTWEIFLYLSLIMSIFIPKVGLIGPIIGLILISIKTYFVSINKE